MGLLTILLWAPPPAPDPELVLNPAAIADAAGPLPEELLETLGVIQITLLPAQYGVRTSPRQFLQLVTPHVLSSNGNVERRFSQLRPFRDKGRVYMVYEASGVAATSRQSRPDSYNDVARQHIGRPHRSLRKLQVPAPAFWPMADSGATVNVVWDTEFTVNFRARSHLLRGFQGMASFAIGEAFVDVLKLAHIIKFRIKAGLPSICLQETTTPGLCPMRGLRFSR